MNNSAHDRDRAGGTAGGAVFVVGGSAAFSSVLPENSFLGNAPFDCGTASGGSIDGNCFAPVPLPARVRDAADGSTIELAAGTFAWESQVTCTGKTITIRGAGKDSTVLDAGGVERFFILERGCVLMLRDVSLRNGNGAGGGAIFAKSDSSLDARNVEFKNNVASGPVRTRTAVSPHRCRRCRH
jgi:hypothetical protein